MAANGPDQNAHEDPFQLRGEPAWVWIPTQLARALGAVTLAAYSAWFLSCLWHDLGAVVEAERAALATLAAALNGTKAVAPMAAVAVAGWIVGCILSAVFLRYVWNEWRKKIVSEWKWVWRQLTSGSFWEMCLGGLGLVLTLVDTVFWMVVTVVAVVVVLVNLKVLFRV